MLPSPPLPPHRVGKFGAMPRIKVARPGPLEREGTELLLEVPWRVRRSKKGGRQKLLSLIAQLHIGE